MKLCLALAALTALAGACLWDRDTLAEETRGKVDVLYVIVGRFERNPPLYYEMRLQRVAKELESSPEKLDLYDDAGVAADRLGNQTDAIEWMAKKKTAMDKGAPAKGDKYRYYSNLGTFYCHRWFVNKADKNKPEDLDKGIDLLKKALEINPNAHFGRERYQLAIMEWVKGKESGEGNSSMALSPLASFLESEKLMEWHKSDKAVEALSGLIRLGTAWESVDVFAALAEAFAFRKEGTTSEAAMLRMKELVAAGKKSLNPQEWDYDFSVAGGPEPTVKRQAQEEFKRLRREADAWHQERTAFMTERLRAGKHPDVDKDFWSGYIEQPLKVNDLAFWKKPDTQIASLIIGAIFVLVAIPTSAVVLIVWAVRKSRKRQTVP